MIIKDTYKEAKKIIESAIEEEDNKKLRVLNIKLMKKLQKVGITDIQLTSLGNDIALGSSNDDERSLLDRNSSLDSVCNYYNMGITKYTVARDSEFNHIHDWIINNTSTKEIDTMNVRKLNEDDIGIRRIIRETDPSLANIIIYNGCNLRQIHTIRDLKKDLKILNYVLTYIQSSNRKNEANTQVYVSGIPNVRIFNFLINKKVKLYSNATYVKPASCDLFKNGHLNFQYNDSQYVEYNKRIIESIEKNYVDISKCIEEDRNTYSKKIIKK